MRTKRISKFLTLAAAFGLVFCSFQASPEDIDIFSVDETNDINNPNVLFVIENNANWTAQLQHWPDKTPDGKDEDQGASEISAIRTVIAELDDNINVGLLSFIPGGTAGGNTDFGYVRYHIRPMNDTNKANFKTILNRIYPNVNDTQTERRAAGGPFGTLFHTIYTYLAGVRHPNDGLQTPADPATATGDTEAYQGNFGVFQSPLTTLDTCTRTIVIFISNNSSGFPEPDSDANKAALHALAGGGAAGDAAVAQLSMAEYSTTTKTGTDKLGFTPSCYTSAASCSSAVNADPACTEEGYGSCYCSGTEFFPCPSNHYTVVGTNVTSSNPIVADYPKTYGPYDAPTNQIGATCKSESQIPATALCPSNSTAFQNNTPSPGQTTTTDTSWTDCKYVATNQTGCVGQKSNWEIRGQRTDVVTVRQPTSTTTQTTLGETTSCYADPVSCVPTNGSWNCALYNQGCKCTTAGDGSDCAASGSKQHRILGDYVQIASDQTGTFAAPSKQWMLDEWTRFLRQSGVPIPGLKTRAQVTTYTIDTFNDQQDPDHSALLFNAARVGGGKYFQAKNRDALINALRQILTEVQAVNSAFSSASLPVNATNRAQNENQVFIGVFKPDRTKDPVWFGNLKRYQLISTGATIDLGDAAGNPAINNQTGFLTDCAASFWTKDSGKYWFAMTSDDPDALSICTTNSTEDHSDLPDGPFVEKGAVAQVLRTGNAVTGAVADDDGNYPLNRNVLTVSGGAMVPLTAATFDDGNASTDETFEARIVNFIRGADVFDEDGDYGPLPASAADRGLTEPRSTIHGDVVHSRPQPINYGTDGVVVYYGSNDGHFRAVKAGKGVDDKEGGRELWSFVAPESFTKFGRLFTNTPIIRYFGDTSLGPRQKDYFFDGSTGVYQPLDNSVVLIFPTLRRGGRRIYGLDVTKPTDPQFLWSAGCDSTGCADGKGLHADEFKKLGQTWGLPNVAFIKGYCGVGVTCDDTATPPTPRQPVIVLAGGYDECEDQNTWSPPCTGTTGAGVYVLDAKTGELVRHFDFEDLDGFAERSAPADVALIDADSDTMVDYGYAVDTGGNIYRMDFIDGPLTKVAIDDPLKWPLARVAFTNGRGHKFLFPPSLVQITASKVYLAIGSGDREHPLRGNYPYEDRNGDGVVEDADADGIADVGVLNRFYVFKNDLSRAYVEALDSDPVVAKTQAQSIDLNGASMANYTTDPGCDTPTSPSAILPNDTEQGWFMDLGAAGKGEQVVTSAVIAAGFVFFSTNRPTATSATACTTSLGEARGYFVNLLNRSGAIGVTGACGGSSSSIFVGGGLPPSPVLATVPIGEGCATQGACETRTVVIGAVQKTGEPSSPIQSQRVNPPIPSARRPIYWYKSTGDK